MTGTISHEMVDEGRRQMRMADEYESVSDYITSILKLRLKMRENDQHLSPEAKQEILELHDKVTRYIDLINTEAQNEGGGAEFFSEAKGKGMAVTKLMKEYRNRHMVRVGQGKASPLKSLIYMDMLTGYRRIKDHAFNIAEVLAGEK
jgi:phosphate:Na+ symporter